MKPSIKKAWVRALRSGEYDQGRGALHVAGKWCCLGVLCNLPETPGEWEGNAYAYADRSSCSSLPDTLNEYCDLPAWPEGKLIELNDEEKASFDEIADWIEENL